MPVQLTIAHDITDQINVLAGRENPSEMELARVKREIEKVKNADAAQYYMLLGMFYSVIGDEAESRSNHERSLRLSSEIIFLENYAFSLKRLDAEFEALELLLRAFEQSPTDEVLEEVAQAMIYSGDFAEFERIVERFNRANPEKRADSVPSVRYIATALDRFARAEISIEDFKLSMGLVRSVLLRNGLSNGIETMTFSSGAFDEVPHVDIIVRIKTSSSDVLLSLNDEIADAMAGSEDIEAWNRLIFTVCDYVESAESEVA
ncbi:hypothetical protein WCE02_17780 [Pseudomonas juntendi]|uniref:hypothetical protein n=1 Tax=Pseudomonas juntendi TaxID=2666183 RepID=UPI0034D64FF0